MIPLKNPTDIATCLQFLCEVDARGTPGSNESLVNAEPTERNKMSQSTSPAWEFTATGGRVLPVATFLNQCYNFIRVVICFFFSYTS